MPSSPYAAPSLLVAVVLSALVVGCGPAEEAKAPDPRPGAAPVASAAPKNDPPPTEAPMAFDVLGKQIVTWLSEGKNGDVRKLFGEKLSSHIASDDALGQLWESVQGKVGKYQRTIGVTDTEKDGVHVVLVTCEFKTSPMDVKLVFDASRRLAGFFLTQTQNADAFGPRPQTPKPPFAYEARDVTYESPKEKATIAGTLSLPRGNGPFPAVLLITGSGAQDRDETLLGHKPFLVIADQLTRNGVAVLRVDDRGVGKSSAENPAATIETHATDVEAGLAFLRAQKEIDPKRVGLMGHSEGGIIAAVVAARSKDVAFVVSLAGTGLSGAENIPLQVDAMLRAKGGMSDQGIKAIVLAQRNLMKVIDQDGDDAAVKAALDSALATATTHAPTERSGKERSNEGEITALKSPWYKSFVKLDPRKHWSKVTVPVLALNGEKDTQVPADANLTEIRRALTKARNKDVTIEKLAGLNHLFQATTGTGMVDEYAKIEETFNPRALDVMTTWVKKRVNAK